MSRPTDLAQPFSIDRYPVACTCPDCAPAEEPDVGRQLAIYALLGTSGLIAGQLFAWLLDVAGVLAAIGIG